MNDVCANQPSIHPTANREPDLVGELNGWSAGAHVPHAPGRDGPFAMSGKMSPAQWGVAKW